MRSGNNAEIIKVEGKVYSFSLGSDFVAEHERGLRGIKLAFGVGLSPKGLFKKKTLIGVESRTITILPETFYYGKIEIKSKMYYYLLCLPYSIEGKDISNILKDNLLYPYIEEEGLYTAWDDRSFGILVEEKFKGEIETLYKAFLNKDIVIMLRGGNLLENKSLDLVIRSSMGKEEVRKLYDEDLDYINLLNIVEKTKIKTILNRAGKRYFALSPKWKDQQKKEVIFYLNPMEQDNYECGWFTVEELKEWVEDKGPVIKSR